MQDRNSLQDSLDSVPYEEIAVALGLPVATLKVKVHRARLRLAQVRNQGVSAE
jgi:DNA-directed RNA polymerase specialized sigma24 family protein